MYSLLFFQKIFFAYIIRLRVVFASISFPDRAHTRVLWLYNDMLAVRYKKFFFAKDAMESWVDEPEKIPQEDSSNFLLRSLPQLCFVLKYVRFIVNSLFMPFFQLLLLFTDFSFDKIVSFVMIKRTSKIKNDIANFITFIFATIVWDRIHVSENVTLVEFINGDNIFTLLLL